MLRALPPPLQLEAAKQLRLQLLLGSEIAPVLPSSALARLTLEMSEVVVPAGELLLLEGDVCSTSMFIVMDGQFEILATRAPPAGAKAESSAASAGRSQCAAAALVDYAAWTDSMRQRELVEAQVLVVATAERGATLGAASFLLEDVSPSATVRATRRSCVLELERQKLEGVLWRRGLAQDSSYLRRMDRQLREIGQRYREANDESVSKDSEARASLIKGRARSLRRLRSAIGESLRSLSISASGSESARLIRRWRERLRARCSLLRQRPVVKPDRPWRRAWDALMAAGLVYLLLSLPLMLAVCPTGEVSAALSWRLLAAHWGLEGLLLVDSLLMATCFPFLDKGREVFLEAELAPTQIWAHYKAPPRRDLAAPRPAAPSTLRAFSTHSRLPPCALQARRLRLDLVATAPYDLCTLVAWAAGLPTPQLLLLATCLCLPRLLRCYRLGGHVRSVASLLPPRLRPSGGGARLAVATALYLFTWHCFACMWLLVAYAPPMGPEYATWRTVDTRECAADVMGPCGNEWAHRSLGVSYARAWYFTITVMSTVGYGDVRPQNAVETFLCQLVALAAAVSFASLIGLISSLVRCGDIEEEALKTQMDYVQHFMRHHHLPARLRTRISAYYKLFWRNARVGQSASLLESSLPRYLLRDLRLAIHRSAVSAVRPLRSLSFFPLKEVCLALRPEVFLDGDVVLAAGEPATKLYLVDLGSLKASRPRPAFCPSSPSPPPRRAASSTASAAEPPSSRPTTSSTTSFSLPAAEVKAADDPASFVVTIVGPGEEQAHVGEEMLLFAAAEPPLNQAQARPTAELEPCLALVGLGLPLTPESPSLAARPLRSQRPRRAPLSPSLSGERARRLSPLPARPGAVARALLALPHRAPADRRGRWLHRAVHSPPRQRAAPHAPGGVDRLLLT